MEDQTPSLLNQYNFGFTPSPLLADFLKRGDELWREFTQFEESEFWVNRFYPTGCVVKAENGHAGIFVGGTDEALGFIIVPDLDQGRWHRASIPFDRTTIVVLHAPSPDTAKELLLRDALSAFAFARFVGYEQTPETIQNLTSEQVEFLFLLKDTEWIIASLIAWQRSQATVPFAAATIREIVAPGLQRHLESSSCATADPITDLLLLRFAADSNHRELRNRYVDPLKTNVHEMMRDRLHRLTPDALRQAWTKLDRLELINRDLLGAHSIREALEATVRERGLY